MQPELERNRSNPRQRPPESKSKIVRGIKEEFQRQSETIKPGQLEGALVRRTFAQETSVFVGVLLLIVGFVGFVVDNLLGAHLSYAHNLIHLVAGALLVGFAFKGEALAKKCAVIFGSIYAILGVLGFIVGTPGMPTVGNLERDDNLWVLSPEVLEFGTRDHVIHLILGAALIASAVMKFRRLRREAI